jgi:hypothetical protein
MSAVMITGICGAGKSTVAAPPGFLGIKTACAHAARVP